MNEKREHGYYWVRLKRTKKWIIALWMPSLNQGKGHWDTAMFADDIRGGFDLIDEIRLTRKEPERIRTKRVRRLR